MKQIGWSYKNDYIFKQTMNLCERIDDFIKLNTDLTLYKKIDTAIFVLVSDVIREARAYY